MIPTLPPFTAAEVALALAAPYDGADWGEVVAGRRRLSAVATLAVARGARVAYVTCGDQVLVVGADDAATDLLCHLLAAWACWLAGVEPGDPRSPRAVDAYVFAVERAHRAHAHAPGQLGLFA